MAAGLEPRTFGFRAQVANHQATRPWSKDSGNYDASQLPIVTFIVNCTQNYGITSKKFMAAEIIVMTFVNVVIPEASLQNEGS